MNDKVNKAYGAAPERLFVIDKSGKIAYRGDQGPWGFKPVKKSGGRSRGKSTSEGTSLEEFLEKSSKY